MRYKILIIDYRDLSHPEAGGAEIILHEIFKRIARKGHEVSFLCSHYNSAKYFDRKDSFRIFRVGNQYNFNLLAPYFYQQISRRENFDLIIEDIDKIPFFMPKFAKRTPVMAWVPHLFGTTVFQQAPFPLAAYVYIYEQFIPYAYKLCQFIVLSKSTMEDLLKRGISQKNVHIVSPGIDHALYKIKPNERKNLRRPIILYLGRLKKYKCIEYIIYAMPEIRKEIPDTKYYIVGSGDYLPTLKKITTKMKLEDSVQFLGPYHGEAKVNLLRQAKLLAYTSPKEGWGMSIIEANACGTPVIASNSPGLRDSVLHGKTGFLVKHGNIKQLAEKSIRLLKDEVLWQNFSENAIDWAIKFNWEDSAEKFLALIQDTLEKS